MNLNKIKVAKGLFRIDAIEQLFSVPQITFQ